MPRAMAFSTIALGDSSESQKKEVGNP